MPDANGYWTDSDRDAVVQSIVQQLAQHHASMQQYIDVLLAAQGQDPAVQAQNRVQAWTAILGSLRRLTQTADAARTSLEGGQTMRRIPAGRADRERRDRS